MARGWESKEVESQIEASQQASGRRPRVEPVITPEQAAYRRERENTELQRSRILHELDVATHARHRAMLEGALKHLDEKLAGFDLSNPDSGQVVQN